MERVSVIEPSGVGRPAIIIAPHGADDDFTVEIAETIAKEVDCYAVINNLWKRSETVDTFNSLANCNNNSHTEQPVVYDEFMLPILKYVARIQKTNPNVDVFIIHGMSNDIRKKAGTSEIDIVLGTGLGNPKSLTMSDSRRNLIINSLQQCSLKIFEGKEGGNYSGWIKSNLNQYFRKWAPNSNVFSVQLEIIKDLRQDADTAKIAGSYIGDAIKIFLNNIGRTIPHIKVPLV